MFEIRDNEPAYAKLNLACAAENNVHGNPIDLIASSTVTAGTSMYINADSGIGNTDNRNKQHGFHFTADNCIGCHACEAACSEKNDLPPHISFRSVGYVEGGTYPNFSRMNISMACNHCDDPVCLKGCPTNAYTKHAEYGAVLQDPETCFGCGYCTWVCPYNAPQLDPVEGNVQKCNMCVDRLEVGLKPACVTACVGNALDFGVIESIPENREEAKTTIPGFPDPEISKPNIRFQQLKSMPEELTRTDSENIKYRRDEETGEYEPVVDLKSPATRQWNLGKLYSRENPLVIFTLVTQAVIGAFSIAFLGAMVGMESLSILVSSTVAAPFVFCLTALQAFVLFLSTQHLGKPMRFYRGFNNLRYSPLSREALAVSIFFGFLPMVASLLVLHNGLFSFIEAGAIQTALLPWLSDDLVKSSMSILVILAVPTGFLGLYYMHMIYRIKARPFWDHWQVLTSFFGTMFSVGAILVGMVSLPMMYLSGMEVGGLITELAPFAALGLAIEATGHFFHVRDMGAKGQEGAASLTVLRTRFGKTYLLRNILLALCLLGALVISIFPHQFSSADGLLNIFVCTLVIASLFASLVSRALFYVIVIPTTMPGAFFWKNKGFEEHAIETGLAKMPQVGIVEPSH
ncbi:MAG: aspartate carbamoyltransferase [SAR86 cluster bacterium]|uniref:Aspartate carbamoyltransferase n=1 Tax=SAR86 cluster bacterium TaxID=2030880 RepID=A0A2A5ATR0_9GAMM|nr:MAG: aspartate carbamoyltransferase [SAR86 cluster bacterium]